MDNALKNLAIRVARRPDPQIRPVIRRLPLRDWEAYSVRFDHYLAVCEVVRARSLVVVSSVVNRIEIERAMGIPPRWRWMPAIPMGWGLAPSQHSRLDRRRLREIKAWSTPS
jgi:hypothetical protein